MSTVSAAITKSPASKFRIAGTRVLAVLVCTVIVFSEPIWSDRGIPDMLLEVLGLLLVGMGTFGRLWTSMYISGRKTHKLITDGPYSIVRNPLYVFNLIGAVGIGLSAESLLVSSALFLAFVAYYPFVIRNEEKRLSAIHGEAFAVYCSRVPRFLPSLTAYREPETCTINVKAYKRTFLDATVFLWIYLGLQLVERMHELRLLPVFFKIP